MTHATGLIGRSNLSSLVGMRTVMGRLTRGSAGQGAVSAEMTTLKEGLEGTRDPSEDWCRAWDSVLWLPLESQCSEHPKEGWCSGTWHCSTLFSVFGIG